MNSKEEVIGYAITQLGLRSIKTDLNVWTVLKLIWTADYSAGQESVYKDLGERTDAPSG